MMSGDLARLEASFRAAILDCERFLSGHGRLSARAQLTELAAEAGEGERPDRYGGGALIADFEARVARLLGKPAAVFMPSGTMAQQIALRVWCERAGVMKVGYHPTSHLELNEERGLHRLHGIEPLLLGGAHRVIERSDLDAVPERLGALLLELPQRWIGGLLPSWKELRAQADWARERGVRLHMYGARLWESAPYYGRSLAQISALFDSVYVSFYKGVGGLAGAALAGPEDFVSEARPWLRRHGGNLISLHPYVLSARRGLDLRLERFAGYRDRAVAIAARLGAIDGVITKPEVPQTNMLHVFLRGSRATLLRRALTIAARDRVQLFGGLEETQIPGHWRFELSVGDATAALTDEELHGWFDELVARPL